MKILLNLLLILHLPLGVLAQGGNLQFNRVLNFTSGANYTVPQGKVLKIESTKFNLSLSATLNYIGCDTTMSFDPNFNWNRINHFCKYSTTNNAHSVQIGPIKIGGFEQGGLFNGYPYVSITQFNSYDCSICPPTYNTFYRIGSSDELNCPLWLSEGEVVFILPYLQFFQQFSSTQSATNGIFISAVEFNVVP